VSWRQVVRMTIQPAAASRWSRRRSFSNRVACAVRPAAVGLYDDPAVGPGEVGPDRRLAVSRAGSGIHATVPEKA
jgi:hypothetical protein